MARRTIETESAYLASVLSACAGGCGVWTAAHVWGVPATTMSHSATAALLAAFTTLAVCGTIGFIEMEANRP